MLVKIDIICGRLSVVLTYADVNPSDQINLIQFCVCFTGKLLLYKF